MRVWLWRCQFLWPLIAVVVGVSSVFPQTGAAVAGSDVSGFIEYEGGGRPDERLEVIVQSPTGGSRLRIVSEPGGRFFIRSLRPGNYEFRVPVLKSSAYLEGSADLLIVGSATAPSTYTVTIFLRRKSVPSFVTRGARTMTVQETDSTVAKEARRLYRRGVKAAMENRTVDATVAFRGALAIDPLYLFALNDLGVQLLKAAKYDEAAEVLIRAIAVAPRSFPPRLNLALALFGLEKIDEASEVLVAAIEVDASSAEAHYLVGLVEKRRRNLEEAIEAFHRSYDLGGVDVIDAQFELGMLYDELNQREAASHAYRLFLQFVQRGPNADRARVRLKALDSRA